MTTRGENGAMPAPERQEVLRVEGLKVYYFTEAGPVKAVEGVSLVLHAGERLGLVGESGSGKSTIALALMRLIKQPGKIVDGSVLLQGDDLLTLSEEAMRKVRLKRLSLVAQGAMNSLNPVKRVRDQVAYGLKDHDVEKNGAAFDAFLADLLERVGLRPSVADMYPHELSGGMKQRVCIAIAISLNPQVIIADEPTSALDVVVQWQVIDTLRKVQSELGAASIQIGHDMGLMAQSVDRLGVMYAGIAGGTGADPKHLPNAVAPIYPAADWQFALPDRERGAARNSWIAAVVAQPGQRQLPVSSPLSDGNGTLQGRRAGPARGGGRPLGFLPSL